MTSSVLIRNKSVCSHRAYLTTLSTMLTCLLTCVRAQAAGLACVDPATLTQPQVAAVAVVPGCSTGLVVPPSAVCVQETYQIKLVNNPAQPCGCTTPSASSVPADGIVVRLIQGTDTFDVEFRAYGTFTVTLTCGSCSASHTFSVYPDEACDTDQEQNDKNDECDDSDDEEGCGDESDECGEGRTSNPVYAASGRKTMSFTSANLALSGGDFAITHSYVSSYEYQSLPLVGNNWAASPFKYITTTGSGSGMEIQLCGKPKGEVRYTKDSVQDIWRTGGSGVQYFAQGTETIGGTNYNVWNLVTPGERVNVYLRAGGGTPEHLVGLRIQDRNLRTGQVHTYVHESEQYFGVDRMQRLRKIYLNGTDATNSEAMVEFAYHGIDDTAYAVYGLVNTIRSYRYVLDAQQQRVPVEVNRTEFVYRGGPVQVWAFMGGEPGSPVMVSTVEKIDGNEERVSIKQYRYHGGSDLIPEYDFVGGDHQILMEFEPEQIEYAAERWNAAHPSTPKTLIEYGHFLLTLADSQVAFTDGSTNYRVVDVASKIMEQYGGSSPTGVPIKVQYVRSGCGCGGPASTGTKFTYEYFKWPSSSPTSFSTKVKESYYDSSSSTWKLRKMYYYDSKALGGVGAAPYPVNDVFIETDDGETEIRGWVTHYEYDSERRRRMECTPESLDFYVRGELEATPPQYFAVADEGLVHVFDYNADNRLSARRVRAGKPDLGPTNDGACSDCTLVEQTFYGTELGTPWTTTNSRPHLVSAVRRYRDASGSTADVDVEETRYFYGFFANDDIAWRQMSIEAELPSENGPDQTSGKVWYNAYELYDGQGRPIYSVAFDNAITSRNYDQTTGYLLFEVRNAPNSIPNPYYGLTTSGFGRNTVSDPQGGALVTSYEYDLSGRVRAVTAPGNVKTFYGRRLLTVPNNERPGLKYYAELVFPHIIDGLAGKYRGPATITWKTVNDVEVAASAHSLDAGLTYSTTFVFFIDSFQLGPAGPLNVELSRSTTQHNSRGQAVSKRQWHSIAGIGEGGGLYTTQWKYDDVGRIRDTIEANGTVRRTSYDVLDRVIKVEVGVVDGSGVPVSLEEVQENFYDTEGNAYATGVGNGHLTFVRIHADEGTYRDTAMWYDYRGRRTMVENALPPHEFVVYDNLDRPVERGVFKSVPTGIAAPLSDRGMHGLTGYSQRGLVYRQRVAIDPDAASSTYLETHAWCDEVGRVVGQWSPTGPMTKTTYDGLGRTTTSYVTDRRDDPAPGASGNFSAVYDATTKKANVVGDVVFSQMSNRYIDTRNVIDLVTQRQRTHDAIDSNTGDLASFSAPNDKLVITTYEGHYYDGGNRAIRTVAYGTNDGSNRFIYGGPAPTINQSSPPGASAADLSKLVTEAQYSDRGIVDVTKAPDEKVTKFFYDDLGRQIAVVENHNDVNTLAWNGTEGRWTATAVGGPSEEADIDRVTSFVFDSVGHITKRVAHIPAAGAAETVQVTQYVYGVTLPSNPGSPNPNESRIATNDLLAKIIYPDLEGGEVDDDRTVAFAYNRAAEVIHQEDQSDTQHEYAYDDTGRLLLDKVAGFGPNIDATINAVANAYDGFGRPEFTRSYTNYGGGGQAVKNAVKFVYDDLWQIKEVVQEPEGDLGGSSLKCSYTYEIQPIASGNYSRLGKLTYPNGDAVDYSYGVSGASGNRISRLFELQDTAGESPSPRTYARNHYLGVSAPVIVDYADADVQLDRTASHNGQRQWPPTYTDNPGLYPAFDKFGRIQRQMWVDGAFKKQTPLASVADRPPLLELVYGYDNAFSRLHGYDARPGASGMVSHEYQYDGLDRLKLMKRGGYNEATSTFTQGANSQKWTLDMLGNWAKFWTDSNGNGAYSDTDELDERTHNSANELTQRVLYGQTPTPPPPNLTLSQTYDKAGNLRTQQFPPPSGSTPVTSTYTHDAWNRLVKIEHAGLLRAKYQYSGLNWRTVREADISTTPDGTIDVKATMYYAASWQLAEQRINNDGDPEIDQQRVYIWGTRYIDDIIAQRVNTNFTDDSPAVTYDSGRTYYHLTDAQFSTMAVLDDTAYVQERVSYDAYGRAKLHRLADLNGDGAVNGFDNAILIAAYGTVGRIEDLNRDGAVNGFDLSILLGAWGPAEPLGKLSLPGVDNIVGYDGYLYNSEVALLGGGQYLARNRVYDVGLGRWVQRDPGGYMDGMALYLYASSSPATFLDSLGLYDIHWRGVWTQAEQDRITARFQAILGRVTILLDQLETLKKSLSLCVFEQVKDDFNTLKWRLTTIKYGLGDQSEDLYLDQGPLGAGVGAQTIPPAIEWWRLPLFVLSDFTFDPHSPAEITLSTSAGDDWHTSSDKTLGIDLLHELMHVAEGRHGAEDMDGTGKWYDPHLTDDLFVTDVASLGTIKYDIQMAEKKCCDSGKEGTKKE